MICERWYCNCYMLIFLSRFLVKKSKKSKKIYINLTSFDKLSIRKKDFYYTIIKY